jgi:hypothetical protein
MTAKRGLLAPRVVDLKKPEGAENALFVPILANVALNIALACSYTHMCGSPKTGFSNFFSTSWDSIGGDSFSLQTIRSGK